MFKTDINVFNIIVYSDNVLKAFSFLQDNSKSSERCYLRYDFSLIAEGFKYQIAQPRSQATAQVLKSCPLHSVARERNSTTTTTKRTRTSLKMSIAIT